MSHEVIERLKEKLKEIRDYAEREGPKLSYFKEFPEELKDWLRDMDRSIRDEIEASKDILEDADRCDYRSVLGRGYYVDIIPYVDTEPEDAPIMKKLYDMEEEATNYFIKELIKRLCRCVMIDR